MSFFKKTIAILSTFLFLLAVLPPPGETLTTRAERELADEFLKAVYEHFEVIDDTLINNYINGLGEKLTQSIPSPRFDFTFHVIREDTFNAFAGPGGNIFLFSGLIEAMETENELAAIMAHEIAHVTGRHIPDMIERSKKTNFASMAGVIAGILVGLGGAPDAGAALSLGSIAAGQSMVLAYSREHELQADFSGRQYLTTAGYHKYGILSALKTIRSREWFGENEIPTYLKTHPAAAERMAMLGSIMAEAPRELKNTYEYDRTRYRVMVLYGNRTNALDRLSRMARNTPEDPAVQYGLGLALTEGGNPEKGIIHLKKAASLKPDDGHIAIALGEAFFLTGRHKKAMALLDDVDDFTQYGPEGMHLLARVQMETGDAKGAVKTLEKGLDHYPQHTQTLFLLGQSLGRQGKIAEAHYFLGKFHEKQGNFENARFHYNRSLSKTDNPEKKTEIEDRIQGLDPKQQKKKERDQNQDKERGSNTDGFFIPQGLMTPSESRAGTMSAANGIRVDRNGKTSW